MVEYRLLTIWRFEAPLKVVYAAIRNHNIVMRQGAEGLARLLGARLVSEENVDLMAKA